MEVTSNCNSSYVQSLQTPLSNQDSSANCTRGYAAREEMMARPGMQHKADSFLCSEPGFASELIPYFREKIQVHKESLSDSPLEDNYTTFLRKMYDMYRAEVVERACKEVEAGLISWTFTSEEEWESKRPAFQDFIWQIARMTFSGAARKAVADAMKEEFPSLPNTFLPSLYFGHEKSAYYLYSEAGPGPQV